MTVYDILTAIFAYIYAILIFTMIAGQLRIIPNSNLFINKISQKNLYFLSYPCNLSSIVTIITLCAKKVKFSYIYILVMIAYLIICSVLIYLYDRKALKKTAENKHIPYHKTPNIVLISAIVSISLAAGLIAIWAISMFSIISA